MEVDSFNLDERVLALAERRAKERLRLGDFYNLQCIQQRPADETSALVKAVEKAYTMYIALVETFSQIEPFAGNMDPTAKKTLVNFGLYVGSVEALHGLHKLDSKSDVVMSKPISSFGFTMNRLTDYNPSLDRLIEYYLTRLRAAVTTQTAEDISGLFFQAVKNTSEEEITCEREKFAEYLGYLEGIYLTLNDLVFNGFNYTSSSQHRVRVSPGTDIHIVGNEDVLQEIDGLVNTIGLYDPRAQTNVELEGSLPQTVLMQGLPGVGKTLLIKYMASRIAGIAQNKRMKSNVVVIDNSFKDKFHGEDIKHLLGYFEEVSDPKGIGLLCIDDAESVLQARDAHDASHIEGQAINAFLSWLNGMRTNYHGNFLVALASNYAEKLDFALTSRMQRKLTVKGPQTPEQYTAIFKIGLGTMAEYVHMIPTEYQKLGGWCEEHKLSGREINGAAELVRGYVRNTSAITGEIQALPAAEQRKVLHSLRRRVDYASVLNVFEQVYEAKSALERTDYERRLNGLAAAKRMEDESELRYRCGIIAESLRDEKPEVVAKVLEAYRADHIRNVRAQFLPDEQVEKYARREVHHGTS